MGARSGSLKQPSLAPARNQGSSAAIAPTIRECVEGRDQAERALRRMQLKVTISGGFAVGDALCRAGNLLSARPWREWLEKPLLMGSSSGFVEGREAGWLLESLRCEGSLSPEYAGGFRYRMPAQVLRTSRWFRRG